MRVRSVLLVMAVACALTAQPYGLLAGDGTPAELPAFTTEREKTALEFVEQHHPELAQVLHKLEHANRPQYEQAIRETFDTSERFARMKQRDETLYGLLLDNWKAQSRAEVLAARLAIAEEADPKLEAELRELIAKKVDLERKAIEHNRQKTLKTLEGIEMQLQWYDENRDSLIERRWKSLINSGKRAGKPEKKPSAPERKTPE